MEFSFDVNKVLPNEITLIRSKDIILDASKGNMYRDRDMHIKLNLSKIIDGMGNASGKAQNLRGAITSALRMKSSDHHLYLLKDTNANKGLGSVVGMLRVGFKHLFLVDSYGQQHECQPLCVLDFYVHESKQRHGYGKTIFNCMLQSEKVHPHELAMDRPSVKSINFLSRHYSLDKPIHQLNKFLVFDSFFKDMSAVGGINAKSRRSAPVHRKMFSRTSSHQDTRYCASASVNKLIQRTSRPQPDYTLSRQLSVLPPIRTAGDESVGENMSSNEELYQTPISRQSDVSRARSYFPKNSNSDTQVRNFSRHHALKQSSKSSPDVPGIREKSDGELTENAQCSNNMETHSLLTCTKQGTQQLTSLDNPLFEMSPKVKNPTNEDESYTVNKVIAKINNNKERLGTSWNVLGVPNNSQMTSNPYSTMKRRGFLS